MKIFLTLLCLLLPVTAVNAEDYSFDIPAQEEKKSGLEFSGSLDMKYSFFIPDTDSVFYQMQFNAADEPLLLSSYSDAMYLNGDYTGSKAGFHLKSYLEYYSGEGADFYLHELYGDVSLPLNSYLAAGKKNYNWGKGYAFNPAGYINTQKDPENPELAREGVLSAGYEFTKSFDQEFLKNINLNITAIAPDELINRRFFEVNDAAIGAKFYGLVYNADVDIMGYYTADGVKKAGADFSVNVIPSLELHGEISFFDGFDSYSIDGGLLKTEAVSGASFLFGVRWLNELNMTVIAEYYRNAEGLTKDQFGEYLDFMEAAAESGNTAAASAAIGISREYFGASSLMRDYVYLKISWPEPFNLLYFTPSVYAVINAADGSFTIGAPFTYKPVTDFEVILSPVFFAGGTNTEYGSKQFNNKTEIWAKFYF